MLNSGSGSLQTQQTSRWPLLMPHSISVSTGLPHYSDNKILTPPWGCNASLCFFDMTTLGQFYSLKSFKKQTKKISNKSLTCPQLWTWKTCLYPIEVHDVVPVFCDFSVLQRFPMLHFKSQHHQQRFELEEFWKIGMWTTWSLETIILFGFFFLWHSALLRLDLIAIYSS